MEGCVQASSIQHKFDPSEFLVRVVEAEFTHPRPLTLLFDAHVAAGPEGARVRPVGGPPVGAAGVAATP